MCDGIGMSDMETHFSPTAYRYGQAMNLAMCVTAIALTVFVYAW